MQRENDVNPQVSTTRYFQRSINRIERKKRYKEYNHRSRVVKDRTLNINDIVLFHQ